ncbi:MAG: hypothetical protein LM557_01840 [Desulfurococcaceae archaeon]|nr:hypothetical protein [Desulfurococcaceae archaeon]MCC6053067.1 hypothetical protein [Desulfurococcaceae archaeon]
MAKTSKVKKHSNSGVLILTNSGVIVDGENSCRYYEGIYSLCSKCPLRGLCGFKQ